MVNPVLLAPLVVALGVTLYIAKKQRAERPASEAKSKRGKAPKTPKPAKASKEPKPAKATKEAKASKLPKVSRRREKEQVAVAAGPRRGSVL